MGRENMNTLHGLQLTNPCLFRARLSSQFDDYRQYGCHGGIDLTYRNAKDTMFLRPAFEGQRVQSGFDKKTGLGLHVVMRHVWNGVTFFTWYCHLEALYLPTWATDTNVMLGIAGMTGNATGRHLHFALQVPYHGKSGCGLPSVVDPVPYFDDDTIRDWTAKR